MDELNTTADAVVESAEETSGGRSRWRSRVVRLLAMAGLAAVAALVAKRMQGGAAAADNWQSSYTPNGDQHSGN